MASGESKQSYPTATSTHNAVYATLTASGLHINRGKITGAMRKALTISCKQHTGWIKHTHGYSCTRGVFTFPRFAPVTALPYVRWEIETKLNRGRGARALNDFIGTPTNNQSIMMKHLLANELSPGSRAAGLAGVIVNIPPGEGKTYLAMAIMAALGRKTAIIVPNSLLAKQWHAAISNNFPTARVGTYSSQGKKDGDVIIIIINSALGDSFTFTKIGADGVKINVTLDSVGWWLRFGLIVYDEVHMYCSESWSKVFHRAQAQYMLGLSATPRERLDKLHDLAIWNVGPVVCDADVAEFKRADVRYTTEVKTIKYRCNDVKYKQVHLNDNGSVCIARIINQLTLDPVRTNIIIQEALALYNHGLCIFIFTDRREHAMLLADQIGSYDYTGYTVGDLGAALPTAINAPDDITQLVWDYIFPEPLDTIALLGGASDEDIGEARSISRIICTTYAYSSTGVSIDKLNAAILATPRKNNMTQILGRIYRLSGDSTITRRIVDVVDVESPLKAQYPSRRKIYRAKFAATITEVKVGYT